MATLIQLAIVPLIFPILTFLFFAYAPGLLDIEPVYIDPSTPRKFEGPLEPNHILDKAELVLQHFLDGPESLAIYRGYSAQSDMYTGLGNGWIVRVKSDGTIEPIVALGIPTCKQWEQEKCGRPLGMRFDRNGTLNVVDMYHGVYKVNVKTKSIQTVYDASWPVDGKTPLLVNDFDMIGRSGDFYFSETTHMFPVSDVMFEVLQSRPNGRIIHHNIHTNVTRTLVDGVVFPNGVQLSPRKDFLLFSETGRNRVMKYHLRGKKEGKLEVFIDNLPGFADNIRTNRDDGYWLPLYMAYPPERSNLFLKLQQYPTIRKVIARVLSFMKSIVLFVESFYPSACLKTLASKLAGVDFLSSLHTPYGLILELNNKGEIIRSLHSPQGLVSYISEVYDIGDALYLASPKNNFLGKLTI